MSTQEQADLAYELWELGWEPQVTTIYDHPEYKALGIGILNVGYGKFNGREFEYPLYPAARFIPDNLRRNLKKMDNGYTLKPCPFCGHQPDENNLDDSIHPVTRDYNVWEAGCVDNEGGCNAYVLGGTMLDAVANWNKRKGE